MHLFYDVLVFLAVWIVLMPWHILLLLTGRMTTTELRQRFGYCPSFSSPRNKRILIHAVSVGEVASLQGLIAELLQADPHLEFVISTGNTNGLETAKRLQVRLPQIKHIQLLPWDTRGAISSWLRHLQPSLVALVECELWPNFILTAFTHNIPLCIINGRIYSKDIRRYRAALSFFRRVLSSVSWIGVQNARERDNFLKIGAAPEKIEVVGDLKLGAMVPHTTKEIDAFFSGIGPMIIGGSTHTPEEEWLLKSIEILRRDFPLLRLVIAPRDPSRWKTLERSVARHGLRAVRWSIVREPSSIQWDVLLMDTIGDLSTIYRYADIVVVGGSFVNRGGHNPIEPAAHGRAIVIGPYVENFQEIVEEMEQAGAVLKLGDRNDLTASLLRLLMDPTMRARMGTAGQSIHQSRHGVAARYTSGILRVLGSRTVNSTGPRQINHLVEHE